jgi:hypothetical protein
MSDHNHSKLEGLSHFLGGLLYTVQSLAILGAFFYVFGYIASWYKDYTIGQLARCFLLFFIIGCLLLPIVFWIGLTHPEIAHAIGKLSLRSQAGY